MNTNFAQSTLRSPIKETSFIRRRSGKMKKAIVGHLALTSLIDAFTILVLFLIVNSSSAEQIDMKDGITLPTASYSSELDRSPVIVYKNGTFLIDDQAVAENDLKGRLEQLRERTKGFFKSGESSILVQADENVSFDKLQPIMIASSYAGIRHVKFAVLQKD
jgi:biopolymer transport protein ExbD